MPLTIAAVTQADAHKLAPIIAAYAQAMKRGAPRRPDEYYAELLSVDPATEVLGAFVNEELVGFAVFFDLPELITGLRAGQMDHIYVRPQSRQKGIARKMIETLVTEVEALTADGMGVKDACRRVVAGRPGAPSRRELYDAVLRSRG